MIVYKIHRLKFKAGVVSDDRMVIDFDANGFQALMFPRSLMRARIIVTDPSKPIMGIISQASFIGVDACRFALRVCELDYTVLFGNLLLHPDKTSTAQMLAETLRCEFTNNKVHLKDWELIGTDDKPLFNFHPFGNYRGVTFIQ